MKKYLWEPSAKTVSQANMTRFISYVNEKNNKDFSSYDELYKWSIEDIPAFWESMWDFTDINFSEKYTSVLDDTEGVFGRKWFLNAKLNFAENLLRYRDERIAMIFQGETGNPREISYKDLYKEVGRLATSLKNLGIKKGDRVAGFMPNMIQTVVAMLATTSMGAIWSSCSPDFGIQGALDRFGQIEPKVLFTANGYSYNGKNFDSLNKVKAITEKISSIETIIVVPYTEEKADISILPKAVHYAEFLSGEKEPLIIFEQLPFDHPLYIMYSSGTTGAPKCIVHGAGGTLIQHLKELILHTDLKREDTIFYFTTCGWMMWNWLVSSLAVGATLMLFDGSPFYPEAGALFKHAQNLKVSVFGTSAKYIASLEQAGSKPAEEYDLKNLRAVLSTGSPLTAESFRYVYRDIKEDLCLSSISGGTDIISCFALGNPILPVYEEELQCRGLGMKVESFDENGNSLIGEKGELVCTAPFPSMPVYFWNDKGNKKYLGAYFERFPDIWHHGDYMKITENGGLIIYGRSDATLNPCGVRIGTSEIYQQLDVFPEILDGLVVGQKWEGDERVVLFIKLAEGVKFTEEFAAKIKTAIKQNTTPRHVPSKILPIEDIPYTINGKKVEIAVCQIIHGEEVKNKEALANPEALGLFKDIEELK